MNAQHIMKMDKSRVMKTSNMSGHSMESVLSEMDLVAQKLNSNHLPERSTSALIASLCENLKKFGLQLESIYKDQLDRCYVTLRNGCRDDRLPLPSRYRLLEVIELRAMNWQPNENLINYYQQKLAQIEAEEAYLEKTPETEMGTCINAVGVIPSGMYPSFPTQFPYPPQNSQMQQPSMNAVPGTPVLLDPGELVKSSGKFVVPARVPGKNHLKDEIVIRNADSGKVMGLKGRRVHMIEELSETIISLQRVAPGARERLVQITGASEENIRKARQLIEETIRRNASPIRSEDKRSPINAGSSCSSISSHTSDEILQGSKRDPQCEGFVEESPAEYKYTVTHENDIIRITGTNLELVKAAKLVLDEYFKGDKNLNNIVFERRSSGTSYYCSTKNSSDSQRKVVDDEGSSEVGAPPPNNVVTVIRQPLTPSSAKEMFDFAESSTSNFDAKNVNNRRYMFAKTNEERSSIQSNDQDSHTSRSGQSSCSGVSSSSPSRITYTREFLLKCAASPLCHTRPLSLDSKSLPASIPVIKKPGSYFDPFKFLSSDLSWSGLQTVSVADEEENGNMNESAS